MRFVIEESIVVYLFLFILHLGCQEDSNDLLFLEYTIVQFSAHLSLIIILKLLN